MKEIEKKFIENLNAFNFTTNHEAVANFSNLWNDIGSYAKHIKKRIRYQDVEDELEYLVKTFEVLSDTSFAYLEYYPNEEMDIWDRVFYAKQKNWAVVVGENGKILTSYKIRDDIIKTLEKHKELFQSKYEMEEVSDAFSKIVRQIYERLTRV
jgi:hypothetical protein